MKTHCFRITLLACLSVIAGLLIRPAPVLAAQSITVGDIVFGVVSKADFDTGYALLQNHPVYWTSDVGWIITVSSLDASLGTSTDLSYEKPLGDLQWKLSVDSIWTPMTQDDTEVDTSADPGSGSGMIVMDFKVLLGWAQDRPGNYGADLVFTISPL